MNDPKLGRLEDVVLREVWKDEARDFTPWLARPENLELLENTLGLGLEADTVETEKDVGPFRADILCQETGSDRWVLIENQLGGTDHIHLGQLLTYAAGRRAMTVVWIAKSFTDEHRAALDWLNEITDEKLRFFGLEIELWSIGGSLPAPKFNVVSKPNNWSRKIKREEGSGAREETRKMRRAYWEALNKTLNDAGGPIHGNRTPQPEGWMRYYTVRRVFMCRREYRIRRSSLRPSSISKDPMRRSFSTFLNYSARRSSKMPNFPCSGCHSRTPRIVGLNIPTTT